MFRYPFPLHWEPQRVNFVGVDESSHGSKAAKLLTATMPGATVLRVARVQNRHLWEQYRHRELHSDTLWTMRWMWLGTFKTPPSEVVSGVDGLSMCGLPVCDAATVGGCSATPCTNALTAAFVGLVLAGRWSVWARRGLCGARYRLQPPCLRQWHPSIDHVRRWRGA